MRTLTFNRIIGAGAMGTVYHAELRTPRGFSRTCAVKVMKTSAGDHEHFLARMRDEARLLGMLQDEQVLGVTELASIDGRDAVVMEYVEGVDLADLIKNGPVPPRALAELGAELAGTLYRAHNARNPQTGEALRVIHRDVKPANVMVTTRGGMRLLDFGVARAAFDSRESQTQGLVLGTLNYFPPEILAGQDPTPAVDIYGLGLSLWECAAAKEWGAPRVQQKRFEERVDRRLKELPPEYAPIVAVLRKVFAWSPDKRPDGGEVERALLEAADRCKGEGLRTWSRNVVPGVISRRDSQTVAGDPLVGRTIRIGNLLAPDEPEDDDDGFDDEEPPTRVLGSDKPMSYDDMGPPAASRRHGDSPSSPEGRPKPAVPARAKKKKRGGPPVWLMMLAGVFLGGGLGFVLLCIALLLVLVLQ